MLSGGTGGVHATVTSGSLQKSDEAPDAQVGALLTFCHKGGVIYISELIDISPSNLDSSL